MARIQNPQEFEQKRQEIINAALQLISEIGYDNLTIAHILKRLRISKGAFYHYYLSKEDLRSSIFGETNRLTDMLIGPLIDDPNLTALQKLHGFYNTIVSWKNERKNIHLSQLRGFYRPENDSFRSSMIASWIAYFSDKMTRIIKQGIREKAFKVKFNNNLSEIVINLLLGQSEKIAAVMLMALDAPEQETASISKQFHEIVHDYNQALERVLGAKPGSIHLLDPQLLMSWFEFARQAESPAAARKEFVDAVSKTGMA